MEIKAVYEFYNTYVKPLYSEIEARNNNFPVELLFEIHAAFDHLKRYYLEEEDKKDSCNRALSHLKRGALDAFKLKLKNFNDSCNKILGNEIDLSLINNGKYIFDFYKDKCSIIKEARLARLHEGAQDIDKAFDRWNEVSLLINEFEDKYLDIPDIEWAKKKTFLFISKDKASGFIYGVLSGIVGTIIWDSRYKLIDIIKNIIKKIF